MLHRTALEKALERSEDSKRMNTAYVERLNLTIRRSIAALQRKSTAYCRSPARLSDQLEILRCYYNFVRPHSSLKFGRVTRTPAMQAGLVNRPLRFRDIFNCVLDKLREAGRMEGQRGWPRGLRPALGRM